MSKLKPLHDGIIFRFVDKTAKTDKNQTRFEEVTEWGFEIKGQEAYDLSMKMPRWGTVESVGVDVTDVKPGDKILIEPLKWTNGFTVDDVTYWKTDINHVLALGD